MIAKKNGFPFKGEWVSIQNAFIRDISKPKPFDHHPPKDLMFSFKSSPIAKEYNPFDYYYNPIPESIVTDILGERFNIQNITLYNLFASLDPNNQEQILKWAYYFGFPRYMNPYPKTVPFSSPYSFDVDDLLHDENFINVDYEQEYWDIAPYHLVSNDIIGFKTFLELVKEQQQGTKDLYNVFPEEQFKTMLRSFEQKNTYYELKDTEHCFYIETLPYIMFGKDVFNKNFTESIDSILEKISPSLECKDGNYHLIWSFSNLLSSMYFMLSLDLVSDKIPIQCANNLCKRFFTPNNPNALYCSDTCQQRAKQQRHRAKLKNKNQ